MRNVRSVRIAAALGIASLVISAAIGCGGSSSKAILKVASNAKLKQSIVVDANGNSLYMFDVDKNGKATCIDDHPAADCGKVWPPLIATGSFRAGQESTRLSSGRPNGRTARPRSRTTATRSTTSAGIVGRPPTRSL